MAYIESRQIPEIHRLACQREHTADERLRGNDRRRRGQHHEPTAQVTLRHHEKKQIRLGRIRWTLHHKCRLPEVVQNQRGKNNQPPTRHDRLPAKVPEVCVESLRPGHRQHDRPHQRPCAPPTSRQQPRTVHRIQRLQDLRAGTDVPRTHGRQHKEPHQHDWPENPPQPARAKTLGKEKSPQNNHSQRQRIATPLRIHTRQTLHRTQHRNRRRDRPVAEEQSRSKDKKARHQPPARSSRRTPIKNPRHQRENSALAVIVGAHDQHHIFHPHHQKERPNNQRRHAQCGLRTRKTHRDLIRIQRARADIAKDNAQRQNRHSRSTGFVFDLGQSVEIPPTTNPPPSHSAADVTPATAPARPPAPVLHRSDIRDSSDTR